MSFKQLAAYLGSKVLLTYINCTTYYGDTCYLCIVASSDHEKDIKHAFLEIRFNPNPQCFFVCPIDKGFNYEEIKEALINISSELRISYNKDGFIKKIYKLETNEESFNFLDSLHALKNEHLTYKGDSWLEPFHDVKPVNKSFSHLKWSPLSKSVDNLDSIVHSNSNNCRKPAGIITNNNHDPHLDIVCSFDATSALDERVREHRLEYSDKEELNIYVVTYNVNDQAPIDTPTLQKHFFEPLHCCKEGAPGIIMFGFQEIDLSMRAGIIESSEKEGPWLTACQSVVASYGRTFAVDPIYVPLQCYRLVGIMLVVFVQAKWRARIHDDNIFVGRAPCGLLGVMGNKGGVSVSIKIDDTTLCFVTCHLAAHESEVRKRNQDYETIKRTLEFTPAINHGFILTCNNAMPISNSPPRHHRLTERRGSNHREASLPPMRQPSCDRPDMMNHAIPSSILDHDHIIWFGDLNYRITEQLSNSAVRSILAGPDWRQHLDPVQCDELLREKRLGHAFGGFREEPITFRPTFKFDPHRGLVYDTSEKQRKPSWCDRILYRSWDASLSNASCYRSMDGLDISDHKPVGGLIKVQILRENLIQKRRVQNRLLKADDNRTNKQKPNVSMNNASQNLHFGTTQVSGPPITKSLEVQNTGEVDVEWRLVWPGQESRRARSSPIKLDPATHCLSWPPERAPIKVGSTLSVGISLEVPSSLVAQVLQSETGVWSAEGVSFEMVLLFEIICRPSFSVAATSSAASNENIMRFVMISFTLAPTCFGLHLELLCRLRGALCVGDHWRQNPDAFRTLVRKARSDNPSNGVVEQSGGDVLTVSQVTQPCVPRVIVLLLEHLSTHALHDREIFRHSGISHKKEALRHRLSCSSEPLPVNACNKSCAEILMEFVGALPSPLIPPQVTTFCGLVPFTEDFATKVLGAMGSFERTLFLYIAKFLTAVLAACTDVTPHHKAMKPEKLAELRDILVTMFAQVACQWRGGVSEVWHERGHATLFVGYFVKLPRTTSRAAEQSIPQLDSSTLLVDTS